MCTRRANVLSWRPQMWRWQKSWPTWCVVCCSRPSSKTTFASTSIFPQQRLQRSSAQVPDSSALGPLMGALDYVGQGLLTSLEPQEHGACAQHVSSTKTGWQRQSADSRACAAALCSTTPSGKSSGGIYCPRVLILAKMQQIATNASGAESRAILSFYSLAFFPPASALVHIYR